MLKIAHRRDIWGDGQVWDGAVDIFSGCGGFSHTELLFDNGESFTSCLSFDKPHAVHPPSYFYRPKGGPQIRRIEFKAGVWEFTDVPCTREEQDDVYAVCRNIVDESIRDQGGYDRSGVLRFVFFWFKEHRKDFFCTEAVIYALQKSLGLFSGVKAWQQSPNRFKRLCDKTPLEG